MKNYHFNLKLNIMKEINPHELKVGDIFTKEIKLKGREAFKVLYVKDNALLCVSRNDNLCNRLISKQKQGVFIYLRSDALSPKEIGLLLENNLHHK